MKKNQGSISNTIKQSELSDEAKLGVIMFY